MNYAAFTLNSFDDQERKACTIGLGTHLFVKVPRPGDCEGTFSVFESSCHLLTTSLTTKGRSNLVK